MVTAFTRATSYRDLVRSVITKMQQYGIPCSVGNPGSGAFLIGVHSFFSIHLENLSQSRRCVYFSLAHGKSVEHHYDPLQPVGQSSRHATKSRRVRVLDLVDKSGEARPTDHRRCPRSS